MATQNCASTTHNALQAANGDYYALLGGNLFPYEFVWTPDAVAYYAQSINQGIRNQNSLSYEWNYTKNFIKYFAQ